MKHFIYIAILVVLCTACNNNSPEQKGTVVTYSESDELFPNPERGLLSQIYYVSDDLESHASANTINNNRSSISYLTLYLHSYYLTDYMESDIAQAFLDRLETNMNALREGGGKVVLRFSYKSDFENSSKPWDASPEWIARHIEQLKPYLQKHADVILCVQCGFIGSWGEWYYTSNFKFNPSKDEDFEPRWKVLEQLLDAVPSDRQIALRTPEYKMRYLRMRGLGEEPLTAAEAYQPTAKARIAGHNDCFVSSANDVGTYNSTEGRTFWQEDTKYTFMGGETCERCSYSKSENAIKNMEMYHWTYLNRDYHPSVANLWRSEGKWDEIVRRLGYRFALDRVVYTETPTAGEKFNARISLHNSGFAAPHNKRDVELIFVSVSDPTKKFIYPQAEDPRFWQGGETYNFDLSCTLDASMKGEYKLYLNLPDPYESLHNDPRFSIRLANENVWEETTGYNLLTTITVQ